MRIVGPDGRAHESVSGQESVILGSGAGAAVRIPDPRLSDLHLMLKLEPGGAVTAIDLGSELGTYVSGRRVLKPRSLGPGETISLGQWRVEVLSGPDGKHGRALQVSLLWGDRVLEVRHFADGAPVCIGRRRRNHFHVFSDSVGGSRRLAVIRGGKVALTPPPAARVTVSCGGQVLRSAGAAARTLEPDEQARVDIGGMALVLRQVTPPVPLPTRRETQADYTFLKIAGLTLAAGVALVAAFLLAPAVDRRGSEDLLQENAQRMAHFLVRPAAPPPAKPPALALEEGEKAEGEEGKLGKPEASLKEAEPSRPGSRIVDPTRRERSRQSIRRIGLLGAVTRLGGQDGASNVLGPGGLGAGINDSLGGLKAGGGMGDAHGFGGLGARGTGPGAGGTGLGLGGLGTRGKGRGPAGAGGVNLSGLQKEVVKVVPGKTIVVGGLPREVIFKVVKSHQREIQYCYETALNGRPDLAGKVAVQWTIGPDGAVTDAGVIETTLLAERAEQCILTRIRRWKFPEVPGGGIVSVSFPWVFKPAGSDSGEG